MKNVLIDQSSEYDCGPTTLVNALRFLYERDELNPDLLTAIFNLTLDDYSSEGEYGKRGTSYKAMRGVSAFFEAYGKGTDFPIHSHVLTGNDASISTGSPVVRALESGKAVAVARVWHGGDGHYILLNGVKDGRILAYDPYADDSVIDGDLIRGVEDTDGRVNRSVAFTVFHAEGKSNYAFKTRANADLSDPEGGEIVLIERD